MSDNGCVGICDDCGDGMLSDVGKILVQSILLCVGNIRVASLWCRLYVVGEFVRESHFNWPSILAPASSPSTVVLWKDKAWKPYSSSPPVRNRLSAGLDGMLAEEA